MDDRHPGTSSLAEADANLEGSTAAPGVPSDYCDQLGESRRILTWLAGASDEIPLDDEHRGRFIGVRDDYARTDQEISQVRDQARRSLISCDSPERMMTSLPAMSSREVALVACQWNRQPIRRPGTAKPSRPRSSGFAAKPSSHPLTLKATPPINKRVRSCSA